MSLNTTPRTFVTAEVETAAIFNAEVRDALTGIQAAWSTWVPTLTNLTQGNGTVSARFNRVGKTVDFMFSFVLGSTSAVGTQPIISLPVTAQAAAEYRFNVGFKDASASGNYLGTTFGMTTTTVSLAYTGGANGILPGPVSAALPFTWAVSDSIVVNGNYEAA